MDTNKKAVEVLANAIVNMIRDSSDIFHYDKTVQGIVKEVLGNNKYKVEIRGTVYTVPCCTEQQFSVNDNVLILCVQNDMKRKYIFGKG